MTTTHGGPDGGPSIAHDFSSNASAVPAPPDILQAILTADRQRYPDPHYHLLREHLAHWHQHDSNLVVPTAGGAEAIRRLTLAAMLQGYKSIWTPQPGFGDYAASALALGLEVKTYDGIDDLTDRLSRNRQSCLIWVCEPCNPTGESLSRQDWQNLATSLLAQRSILAIDQAYEPLRLECQSQIPLELEQQAWRLHCPNKALSLTGIRSGYFLAPSCNQKILHTMQELAPSWVLSAEGCTLLQSWASPACRQHLTQSRILLRQWRASQIESLGQAGWQQRSTSTPFWLARPAAHDVPTLLIALREKYFMGKRA